jgi:hypothetical protein
MVQVRQRGHRQVPITIRHYSESNFYLFQFFLI